MADLAEGEAAPAYPEEAGVNSFRRRMILLKLNPPILLLLDRVDMREPRQVTWYYHAFEPFTVTDGA